MAVDLRQVMAAFLTFSMFIMLGNMIKKDHIDPLMEPYKASPDVQYNALKVSKASMLKLTEISDGLWRESSEPAMKPCWMKPSLTNAVAVARHLGAKLAIPDIRETTLGSKRHFGEIYDVGRFVTSLNGVVQVDENPPSELRLPIVRVPHRVSTDFIASKVGPIFQCKRKLKIVTYYDASGAKTDNSSTAYQCLAMFETVKLQSELQQLVDSMVGTLRGMSQKTRGRFVAVDLRVDALKRKMCKEMNKVGKRCYNAGEIGEFMRNVGFQKETAVYLTQTGWSSSLDEFREIFPNTFTKDAIMPSDQKVKLMDYEKMIDFHMCTESDVFVPAFPSRVYGEAVGKRIGEGKTQIIVPTKNASKGATDYVSPLIAKRSHFAYSCFC